MDSRRARQLVLLAVLTLHGGVFWVVTRHLSTRPIPNRPLPESMTLLFLDQPQREVDENESRQPRTAKPKPRISPPREPAVPDPLPSIPAENSDSSAITDWRSEIERAGTDYLEREKVRKAQRAFTHQFSEHDSPEKPGVFGSQAENRRAGRVEGGTRFWVTDNCYFDVPREAPPPPPIAGDIRRPHDIPICKPPPTGGGSELFKNQKPQYLKDLGGGKAREAAEPESKAASELIDGQH